MEYEPGIPPSKSVVPLCVPEIRGNEWSYVKECLDSNWVSSAGPFVDRFERDLAAYVGTKHAVATCNGTAALHIALLIAGVQADDEVLVSTLTFIAPANAIRYVSAWPVFMDSESGYWQMDPQRVKDFLEKGCQWRNGELYNKVTGRHVKAILPVHILGHPVDMDAILEMGRKYNLAIIEDATESLGAKYYRRMVGHLGDVACFSFNGNKIITSGGGGMIVSDNETRLHRAKYLTTQAKDRPVEYIHNEVGYNYRLSNIQAAMGCAQLERINDFIAAKRRIAHNYYKGLKNVKGIIPMTEAPWANSIFWMYTILVKEEVFGIGSKKLMEMLAAEGIQARPLWQPLHQSKAHLGMAGHDCPVSQGLHRAALSLPCSAGLSEDHQNLVIDAIREIGSKS